MDVLSVQTNLPVLDAILDIIWYLETLTALHVITITLAA